MLAFWTDNNSSRIDALFRQSGLFREDSKWDKRADYRERTITAAIARTYETYKPRERADGNGKRPTILTEEQAEREAIQQEDEFTFIVPARQFLSIIDPPICYLIPELLPDRTMALDHGWPRSLKSWAAVEKGIALATGTPAFAMERFRVETPVHVLYLSQEDAESIVRMRVKALLKARKIEQYPETLSFSVFKGIDLDSTEWQDLLCRGIQKNGIRLVIFDPIRRFTSEADRGPHEVGRITQYLRARIINVEGSGSDIVHHDTKPPADGKDDRPRPQRVSGGDWYSSCECPISYERISDTSSLVVPEGYKLSKDPESFQIRLDTDDERNPTRASLIGETVDATDAADLTLHHQIREYVIANPGKAGSAIAKAIHRNKDDVIKALNNSPDFDSVKHRNAHLWHFRGNP